LFCRIPHECAAFIKVSPQSGRHILTNSHPAHGGYLMFAAASRLVPLAVKSCRQIVPPVIATLIAAGLISAYNRAFTGHLQQPRLSALHQDTAEAANDPVAKPLAPAEAVAIYDNIPPPARLWEKEAKQESGKDQAIKLAEPAPAPVRAAVPRPERSEPRTDHHRVAIVEPAPLIRAPAPVVAAPVVVAAPPPMVSAPGAGPAASALPTVQELRQPVLPPPQAQPHYQQPQPQYGQPQYQPPQPQSGQPQYQQPSRQPPPVITAQPVTVPDRPRAIEPAQAEVASPPQGPIGKIVDTLKPSNLFARAREFGEKIEQAGNDILPNIRPQ
jgi:hypothetical protein